MKNVSPLHSIALFAIVFLSGCGSTPGINNDDSTSANTAQMSCYEECEMYGGGSANVAMCKENCDAAFASENSVWDKTFEDYEEESTAGSWPSDMPNEVPEFTYGDTLESNSGMGAYFVDFENVPSTALESYKSDLEDAGWRASIMKITNTLSGSTDDYTIQVMMDPDYGQVQIMVNKK
jgi:hypothetical protein